MRDLEIEIWRDADEHAERYLRELEKLNEREAQSRWHGKALDDTEVRKISSFLKSYSEMRKGEQFVMREVRARARERERWAIGVALVLLGVAAYPFASRSRKVNGPNRLDVN
jgi:zinc/manganese transport system permease protein